MYSNIRQRKKTVEDVIGYISSVRSELDSFHAAQYELERRNVEFAEQVARKFDALFSVLNIPTQTSMQPLMRELPRMKAPGAPIGTPPLTRSRTASGDGILRGRGRTESTDSLHSRARSSSGDHFPRGPGLQRMGTSKKPNGLM